MISFDKAIAAVLASARRLPEESVPLSESEGRALARDVRSGLDMPPFDKSLVDGYALRSSDARPGAVLRCLGTLRAGAGRFKKVVPGTCVKIMTGAPVPAGADAVVMVERTALKERGVALAAAAGRGENIAPRASDMRKGTLILKRGTVIRVSHIAALAASGLGAVRCFARPSVSLVNTGGELVRPGGPLGAGRIHNSNGPMLAALLRSDGIEAVPVIAPDEPARLGRILRRALAADIVLVSGGVSMGDYDLVPAVLKSLGVREVFHKVRVRPGKPMFFGVKGRKLVFGIPGNPVANFLAYFAYIRPAIRRMSGRPDFAPEFLEAACGAGLKTGGDRRAMILSKLRRETGYSLEGLPVNGSADVFALSRAGAFAMVGEGAAVKKGGKVKFLKWP